MLGVSFGRRKEDKEIWWWNEEVQDSIQRKRLAKKKWDIDRTEENRQEYKGSQHRVKREVSKAKQKVYDELYTRLDTREGQKDLYRLARQRDRDGKDVQQVRVIKDRDGRVLTSEESVQRRWKEYIEELMNEENEREKRVEGVNSVEQKVDKIRKNEVRKALKRMKSGMAIGPDDILVELSEEVRQESPWTMMFADDIVICSESREQGEQDLERWRFALERRGMKVSRSKTEYMCVNEREGSGTVRLQGEEVKKVQEFKYLGSTVQSNGECGKEVKKRVQAGWNGWRKVSGVLCDRKILARIKKKVYKTVVRPGMLYGLETVLLRKRQEADLEVAELKMLRFSLGVTRLDRIRNEYIRGTAHVGRLGDKVREARLRWFGHVQRRERPGRLTVINGTMNSAVYQKILKENVRPSVCDVKLKQTWVLQQDNDPKHTSKSTSEWLKKNKMKTLEWPSQSPDLNPIEMLWHDLKKVVHARKPSNVAELQQFCKDEWAKIPPQCCNRLIASYGKCLIAVVAAKGGPTSY
ncbi:hypothetical protein QTP86_000998 [Hemibagrus guttatus]|nr:hypothetical protein QTP86_000998 [Hemibagrus guttatus]